MPRGGDAGYDDSSMIAAELKNLEDDDAADDPAPTRLPEPLPVPADFVPAPGPKPVPAVRVERGRNGRPVLTNEIGVREAPDTGAAGWNH